jgi:uncharacterized protein YutE (UPF0331/DUF86 family)/predicted nucleotidyltransferase
MDETVLSKLKSYFAKREEVILAFVFGSRAKGMERAVSDWDIAVYFTPKEYGELETKHDYAGESQIWSDIDKIVGQDVDFLVMNRARPSLVFTILNTATPLSIKDRRLYTDLLLKTHYEAVDFWGFAKEFWQIRERSTSLTREDEANLVEHLTFLENELSEMEKFKKLTWKEYAEVGSKRRDVERWIENLVMASLDIAKIILSSEKKELPQTYRETLKLFGAFYISESFGENMSQFAELRNIIAHEYLDIRWNRIQKFIDAADDLYKEFIPRAKKFLNGV